MNTKKTLAGMALFAILMITAAYGHGLIIYDVELDFDPSMHTGVVAAAQEYLGIHEEPKEFDYDRELIVVKFNRQFEYSVLVHPLDFSILGFRDDNALSRSGAEQYDAQARRAAAQDIFDSLPQSYQEQMEYGGEEQLYTGAYQHSWFRFVDGVLVANEHLQVDVDGVTGEVVSWRQSVFLRDAESIQINPAISGELAEQIAITWVEGEALEEREEPFMIINKDSPVWVVKFKKLYPQYGWVDGMTGRLIYTGGVRTALPEGYKVGSEIPIIKTDFIRNILEEA